jgi:multidrug resistance efflux pump
MEQSRRKVRTPFKHRLRRFCFTGLPILCFSLGLGATLALWDQQTGVANVVGRAEAKRVNMAAASDGVLTSLPELAGGALRPFDRVAEGQLVVRLDDGPLRALLEAMHGDVAALEGELESTTAEAALEEYDRQHSHFREDAELASLIEKYRLDVIDRNALVQDARLEMQRLNAQLEYMTRARSLVTQRERARVQSERDAYATLMNTHVAAMRQSQENLQFATARKESLRPVESPDLQRILAPIRAAITAAEARALEVEQQIENLELRSPISGTIAAIYCHPGQGVRAGDWILTIAEDEASHIVAYVRAEDRFRPQPGMPARVRQRVARSHGYLTSIEQVGSQWEPMPLELLLDQRIIPLVLPVRLAIPPDLSVQPGEVVDVHIANRFDTAAVQSIE